MLLFWFNDRREARGDSPIQLKEVQQHLKNAAKLSFEDKAVTIWDKANQQIGFALRTSPEADHIKGYAGSTDALIVLNPQQKIIGVSLRSSQDTPGHVEDVQGDYIYLENWQGRELEKVSKVKDLEEHELWGVSGATKTSDCMSKAIVFRSAQFLDKSVESSFKIDLENYLLIIVMLLALIGTFTKVKENAKSRKIIRLIIFVVVVYKSIDLLCLSILAGWSANGAPWLSSPILFAYMTMMFVIPWATRKQVYCQQVCPHGFVQEYMSPYIPQKFSLKLSKDVKSVLLKLPFLLIISAIIIFVFDLPYDMADLEVFAAWYPTRASTICLTLFVVSIIFSALVPKGYCKYACPTGRLLEYARSKGRGDKFTAADKVSGAMFSLTLLSVLLLEFVVDSGS